MKAILLGGGLALLISLLGTHYAIGILSRRGYGQEIRDDGPTTHHVKRGTPTMGGLVIILASVAAYFLAHLLTLTAPSASALLLIGLFIGCGAVGFLDDFIKIVKQRSLGLRSKAKMIGQTLVALVFAVLALKLFRSDEGEMPASTHVSFLRDIPWLGLPLLLAIALIWVIVTGTSNAVNLTDGADGLAAGSSAMVFGAYTMINIWQNNQSCARASAVTNCYHVRDPLDLAVVAAAITGACFGFLWWNAPPASIFMGDTGSLSLGGALAGLAILTRTELLLLILGGLFVVVTLSVMIQVSVFKASRSSALFRKVFRVKPGYRVFRIAPIHHHFEMLGWQQETVVIRFWIITGLAVATGLGVFYAAWVASS